MGADLQNLRSLLTNRAPTRTLDQGSVQSVQKTPDRCIQGQQGFERFAGGEFQSQREFNVRFDLRLGAERNRQVIEKSALASPTVALRDIRSN